MFIIVDVERPPMPYILLECLSREKETSKGMYMLTVPNPENSIKMGRGH